MTLLEADNEYEDASIVITWENEEEAVKIITVLQYRDVMQGSESIRPN